MKSRRGRLLVGHSNRDFLLRVESQWSKVVIANAADSCRPFVGNSALLEEKAEGDEGY